jgi:hypothetical protein
MAASVRVLVSFSQTEVNHVDDMLLLTHADQEVIWFDVSVQETLLVHILDPLEHLDSYHKHCLKRELSAAILEKVLD